MQVTKTYSGTAALGATASRPVSYGASTKATVYPAKVDTVNQIIADFLRVECGVDAYYTTGGADASFLWIWGVPFLFSISGKNSFAAFYGPGSGTALNSGSESANKYNMGNSKMFSGETGTYSFGLVFAGNPNNGFALRFKTYGSSSISQYFVARFMKCTNLINGKDSVVWSGQNIYSSGNDTSATLLLGGMNGIDLDSGNVNLDSFSTALINYEPILHTKPVHRTANGGALPLVPLVIGPYRTNGIYLRPVGFALPSAASVTTEVQHEMTVGTRSFLITNNDSIAPSYINMGLIETT